MYQIILVMEGELPVEYVDNEGVDYFEIESVEKEWGIEIPYYRRPLSEMIDPLLETGFHIDGLVESQPTEESLFVEPGMKPPKSTFRKFQQKLGRSPHQRLHH
jgi:hypothetical protein